MPLLNIATPWKYKFFLYNLSEHLYALKAEQLGDLLGEAVWDEALMMRLSPELLDFVIRYILLAGVDKEAFDRKIHIITEPRIQSSAMTIAEQLRQEGHEKGRQEGRQEGFWIGKIQSLEEFLEHPGTPRETLGSWTLAELEAVHQRLHAEYEARFKRK